MVFTGRLLAGGPTLASEGCGVTVCRRDRCPNGYPVGRPTALRHGHRPRRCWVPPSALVKVREQPAVTVGTRSEKDLLGALPSFKHGLRFVSTNPLQFVRELADVKLCRDPRLDF